MDRLKEYCSFAVRFAGIGYLPLWPLTSSGPGGDLFGASLMCGGPSTASFVWLDWLCRASHPLVLSPALHALGTASACYVGLCLVHRGLRRLRRRPAAVTTVRIPDALMNPSRPPHAPVRVPPPPGVTPRNHFGLRGIKGAADLQDMA